MISIGDSDWDDSDDDELVVTKALISNGHSDIAASNGYSETDIRTETQDFYTFEDLQSATIRGNMELVNDKYWTLLEILHCEFYQLWEAAWIDSCVMATGEEVT